MPGFSERPDNENIGKRGRKSHIISNLLSSLAGPWRSDDRACEGEDERKAIGDGSARPRAAGVLNEARRFRRERKSRGSE